MNTTPLGVDTAKRKGNISSSLRSCSLINFHIYSLSPKYDELASLYADGLSSKVTIAKIDATANDVPEPITGFPTIKLFPAGAKDSPIEYLGTRTVDDLANFVKENGKHQADAYSTKEAKSEKGDEAASSEAPAATGDDHDEL